MAPPDVVLRLTIPPQPRRSRLVRDRVTAFALENGVDETDLGDFLAALGEAVANAIEHGGTSHPIRVECRISEHRIQALVEDRGVGFTRPAETADLPDPTSERGRGLPLMRRCSDIFTVRSAPGRGTAVKIGRFLSRPLRPPFRPDGRRISA
jgi:anti-sigma regulatory factor (Ser/Thr protein kinase)